MLNGCVCARCTLLVRGDSGPDSSHDSEVCTRTFPAEGSHRHTKSQSHLGRHTIHPPPWRSAACLPQYCGIRCGMGSTLNTSEWWKWFSQGRKKPRLKGHMKDCEQDVSKRGSFFLLTCYGHLSESYLPNQCQYLCTLISLKAKVLWSVKQKVKSMSWTLIHNTNTNLWPLVRQHQHQHNWFQKDKYKRIPLSISIIYEVLLA